MKKLFVCCLCFFIIMSIHGCSNNVEIPKIGVSLAAGHAERWKKDVAFMEERAKELGDDITIKMNTLDTKNTQLDDCKDLVDSGIDVLILMLKNPDNTKAILEYATQHKVKVISYSRVILDEYVDVYVGYDSTKIGQAMGQYLTEKVDKGSYILLKGDKNDVNTSLLYDGAMKYIKPIQDNLNILTDVYVDSWDPEIAKKIVKEVLLKNNKKVDAILAPNDKIAGACAEVLEELQIKNHVSISGMDAELSAIKRITNDKQDMTVYLKLRELAFAAVETAHSIALGEDLKINAKFDNQTSDGIDAYLINGQPITKENINIQIIEKKIYTKEEIYN